MKTALSYTFWAIDNAQQIFERLLWLIVDFVIIPAWDFTKANIKTYYPVGLMILLPLSMSMRDSLSRPELPLLIEQQVEKSFQFDNTQAVFTTRVDLDKVKAINYQELRKKLLGQVPYYLRSNMDKYLEYSLAMAEKYQIDPFWVLAIMKTESHFNTQAVSRVGARGLMQVMPRTGVYLAEKLKGVNYGPFKKEEYKEYYRPRVNIEMGVYYLGYLLEKFRYNPYYATMAYNMGPGRLNRKLRQGKGRYLKRTNNYLRKVKKNYFELLSPFKQQISNG